MSTRSGKTRRTKRESGLPRHQRLVALWLLLGGGGLLGGALFAAWLDSRLSLYGAERAALWLGCFSGGATLLLAGLVLERQVFAPLRHLQARLARLAANPDGAGHASPRGWLSGLGPDLARVERGWSQDRARLAHAREDGARAASATRQRLETLVQALPTPLVVCDRHRRLLLLNAAAERLFAGRATLGLGRRLDTLLPGTEAIEALAAGSRPRELWLPWCQRWLRLTQHPLPENPGESLIVFMDADHAPLFDPKPTVAHPAIPPRPEFHDFGIAELPPPDEPRAGMALSNLEVVAFDTETTGLALREGDTVVSIGAWRIVNARVVEHEPFTRLVHPGRPIPPASTAIHSITDADVRHAPPLTPVLGEFRQYVGDAVLLAHNASFDMLAISRSGVAFNMPVLDTLLISRALDAALTGHDLDTLAARYAIPIAPESRHTALGDARLTAALWLALLPRLDARGIDTLEQLLALQASAVDRRDATLPPGRRL